MTLENVTSQMQIEEVPSIFLLQATGVIDKEFHSEEKNRSRI